MKNPEGRVAFGTGALEGENSGAWSFEFFSKPEIAQAAVDMPILIYGSATDLSEPNRMHRPGYVTAIAVYEGFVAGRAGKHPRPEFRPAAALAGDWAYPLFWEVSRLRRLTPDQQVPLKELKLPGTGKARPYSGAPPRGPVLVWITETVANRISSND